MVCLFCGRSVCLTAMWFIDAVKTKKVKYLLCMHVRYIYMLLTTGCLTRISHSLLFHNTTHNLYTDTTWFISILTWNSFSYTHTNKLLPIFLQIQQQRKSNKVKHSHAHTHTRIKSSFTFHLLRFFVVIFFILFHIGFPSRKPWRRRKLFVFAFITFSLTSTTSSFAASLRHETKACEWRRGQGGRGNSLLVLSL